MLEGNYDANSPHPMDQQHRPLIERHLGMSLKEVVAKRTAKDPVNFNNPAMDQSFFPRATSRGSAGRKKEMIAVQAEMAERRISDRKMYYELGEKAKMLFRDNGMMMDQKVRSRVQDPRRAAEIIRMLETTLGSDVATVALQILPIITRAMSFNPILDLVGTFNATGPQVNIVYLDITYASASGTYSAGDRIDINQSVSYSDRTDCTASAKKLNAKLQKELATVTDKVLGADICLPALQDAMNQYGLNLEERLSVAIVMQMIREWSRLVSDDLRTMAGKTGSWAATVPGPYSAFNTSEWRKVLFETMVYVDSQIKNAIYEGTQWAIMNPNIAQVLERVKRFVASPGGAQNQPGTISMVAGEFGDLEGRWSYWADPYFADKTILMGRRGSSLVENDFYYWIPYVMADDVRELFEPDTMTLTMGAITRAARKMIVPNAFGRVDITGSGGALV